MNFKKCTYRFFLIILLCCVNKLYAQNIRTDISLNKNWYSIADDTNKNAFNGFEKKSFNDKNWEQVDVPQNWDAYEGYRRKLHGNRHGYAWYRKTFSVKSQSSNNRYFLFFEGVSSYATVWLNGKQVGYHAGGRTTFTLDVTCAINLNNKQNLLAVRADHPAYITDLPWVCGGCSDERGFSEGSQPMGIFRPVHLIITDEVRIEPFGVHVWNDTTISNRSAKIFLETEIKNYSSQIKNITLVSKMVDKNGKTILQTKTTKQIAAGENIQLHEQPEKISNPHLWSLTDPYLYKIISQIYEGEKLIDEITTPYGIRTIKWQLTANSTHQFLLNGKPVFINGIAEYEHLIGNSHAFSDEQIRTRAMEVKATGFNAFRDAHQPHNLLYQNYWDSLGILWWTQLSAHIWFDTPEFRKNFKELLKDWVKERRNSPSIILWGLQNESKLPEDFAKECTELIRQLDPTASSQRLVTTCNGGSGTDWDVPQNWTGTYGGNPATYGDDIKKQILVGEYGAWRTLDLHTEGGFVQNGPLSEERMAQLMEMKVKLGEAAKDSAAGHFAWLLTSHDNPGRVQGGEGYRELDRIGPVNYKGLMTPWEEPTDAFYMYRSNYVSKEKEPMVYIASHTWPNRWITTGIKNGIVVYSNCDEVELFNDVCSQSLGRRKKNGIGTHFTWDSVNINYNVLYAVGYVNGKEVATDYIVLNNLPQSPNFSIFYKDAKTITAPQLNYNYIYRINCGGPDYKDKQGNTWLADCALEQTTNYKLQTPHYGSTSWTNDFPGMPSFFASQRKTNDPINGTKDWPLFQTFRYGRDKLKFHFPLPNGEYLVELYFTEPWFGIGGGMDCKCWRLFDVAVNDKTVLKDVDIWKEVGNTAALKKTVVAKVTGGLLTISFPHIASGQAVISAIAIASLDKNIKPVKASESTIHNLLSFDARPIYQKSWVDVGDTMFTESDERFNSLPPVLFGAEWLQTAASTNAVNFSFSTSKEADIFVALKINSLKPAWINGFNPITDSIITTLSAKYFVYRKRFIKNETLHIQTDTASSCIIFALPVSSIEPAYDLQPVTSYKAANAKFYGEVSKRIIDGKERAVFNKPLATNAVEWNISIGAADIYSLTISYNNPSEKAIKGRLQFFSADGTLMKEEAINFTYTKPGKSNYINSSTATMINAGNYKVKLSSSSAEGLSINSLDVQ